MRKVLVGILPLVVLAGCSSDKAVSSSDSPGQPTTSPSSAARPAGEVLAEGGRDTDGHRIKTGKVGGPAIVINDVALSVVSVGEPYDRDGERVADIEVRAENVGRNEASSPDFLLRCGDENQAFYNGTTYANGSPLPPKSFLAGKIVSAYPEGCASPTIVTEFSVTYDADPVARWPL